MFEKARVTLHYVAQTLAVIMIKSLMRKGLAVRGPSFGMLQMLASLA